MSSPRLPGALLPALILLSTAAAARGDFPAAPQPPPPDYAVAFWYRRSDPFATIRHQVYDVRKGELTPAVAGWLKLMRTTHSDYEAYLKEVRVNPASGESPRRQLAAQIIGEYLDKAGPGAGFGLHDQWG